MAARATSASPVREREGGCADVFTQRHLNISAIFVWIPAFGKAEDCGFDLLFREGPFCKSITDASSGPSDRRSTGGIVALYLL